MLNGKFYTGLTENQLNRSAGPNRQKTNFFWPDEKEVGTKNASPRVRNSEIVARKYNESGEVRDPKDLFKKQLSSKILFNDATDASKTPPSVRRQNQRRELNRNVYEKINNFHINGTPIKPKTFESKIEFYDFVETEKPKETTTPKLNSTKMVHEKKRISFNDNDEWDKTKKGILKDREGISKDRDVRVRVEHNVPIDISEHRSFNRNNGSKLQMSKSMDNIAKVKLAIMDDCNERNEKVNETTNQLNKLNINNKEKINFSRRIEPRYDLDTDYNPKGHNEQSKYNIPPIRRNDILPIRRNERQSQRNSFHGLNNDNFEIIEERHSTTKNYEDNRYARRNSDQYDHNERSNLRKQLHTKNNAFNDRLQANAIDEVDEYHDEIAKKITIPDNTRYRNEPRNERVVSIKRSSTINGANDYPNEARRRAHTHLQSNIFFHDDDRLQQQRPLSIRESAVTRVGVGLPDI